MSIRILSWSGPKGGKIDVSFDDEYFGAKEMQSEIDSVHQAYPNLPDEVPLGAVFTFSKERSTGHLTAWYRIGDTVYRNVAQHSLHRLWNGVGLIDQLLHPLHYQKSLP
jgi:hypothetical protein